MNTNKLKDLMDSIAVESFATQKRNLPFRKVIVGLRHLETATTYFVVPCIEGLPKSFLKDLLTFNIFEDVTEITKYVSYYLDPQLDIRFYHAWNAFLRFIDFIQTQKSTINRVEVCYISMLFSAIVLRSYSESMEKNESHIASTSINLSATAEQFFVLAKSKAVTLSIRFDPEGLLIAKIVELRSYLDSLPENLIVDS